MAKIFLDIDDRLLGLAAEQLGTANPQDTIEAALLAITGSPASTQLRGPKSSAEATADIARADAAMQEPWESVTLEQAENELDQLDARSSNFAESRQSASERLLGDLRNGMLADLADPEIMRHAQR
jgi:hypothetical protein